MYKTGDRTHCLKMEDGFVARRFVNCLELNFNE